MANHGGPRPNSGRPVGSKVTRVRELVDKYTRDGAVTPIDVLLQDMRFFHKIGNEAFQAIQGKELTEEVKIQLKEALHIKAIARECAQAAAPYIHPKLNAVSAPDGGPIQLALEISFK